MRIVLSVCVCVCTNLIVFPAYQNYYRYYTFSLRHFVNVVPFINFTLCSRFVQLCVSHANVYVCKRTARDVCTRWNDSCSEMVGVMSIHKSRNCSRFCFFFLIPFQLHSKTHRGRFRQKGLAHFSYARLTSPSTHSKTYYFSFDVIVCESSGFGNDCTAVSIHFYTCDLNSSDFHRPKHFQFHFFFRSIILMIFCFVCKCG